MKQQIVCLCLVATLFSVVSCKKTGSNSSNNSVLSGKIKTESEQIYSTVLGSSFLQLNFSYDSQERLTTAVNAANSGSKEVYSYPKANEFYLDIYDSGKVRIHDDITYDNNDRIVSSYQFNNTQDTAWDTYKYTYDSKNNVTSQTVYNITTDALGYITADTIVTHYTYDALSNITSTIDNYGDTTSYTYYSTTYTASTNTYPSKQFTGNLVKTATQSSGGTTITGTYVYAFDSANRVSTITETTSDGSTTVQLGYTYY
jgi:YD repeat-containing protein